MTLSALLPAHETPENIPNKALQQSKAVSKTEPKFKITQEQIVPYIIKALGDLGGRAHRNKVLQVVYNELKDIFSQPYYQEILARGDIRWRKMTDYARLRAKHNKLIRETEKSGRGIWELTEKGWEYYETIKD